MKATVKVGFTSSPLTAAPPFEQPINAVDQSLLLASAGVESERLADRFQLVAAKQAQHLGEVHALRAQDSVDVAGGDLVGR